MTSFDLHDVRPNIKQNETPSIEVDLPEDILNSDASCRDYGFYQHDAIHKHKK